jgi:hypothetical protein
MIDSPLILIALAFFVVAAWRWPYVALAFVIVGATPYYATLQVLGVETSGALTGLVFGAAGAVGIAKILMQPEARANVLASPHLLLFVVFVVIWLFRWFSELPPSTTLAFASDFGTRAPAFMFVFSVFPFIGALAIAGREQLTRLIRAMAAFGLVGIAILLVCWVGDVGSVATGPSGKWEPIEKLTSIMLSFDLGVGLLALFFASEGLEHRGWRLVRWCAAVIVVALMLRIGERGPFVFMISALLTLLFLRGRGSLVKKAVGVAAILALGVVSMQLQEVYGASRAVSADKYTAEGNEDRLSLIEVALNGITERPIEGWGSGLVGKPVGNYAWAYSHVMVLDALLETGLIGATPFFGLYLLALVQFVRLWRSHRGDPALVAVAVGFLYTMLEAQVSGHVSASKHAWLFTGLLAGTPAWMRSSRVPSARFLKPVASASALRPRALEAASVRK